MERRGSLDKQSDLIRLASSRLAEERARKARASSKYDYVKVKVWLGEHMQHYYILSRFLISRMLTVTRLPQQQAVKISLEVKKYLVDNEKLDISQDELEAVLFRVLRSRGFGDEYVSRYRMVSAFLQARRPLVVLVCGTACTGKSSLAQQLASRLNLPNVLQTDVLYELLRTGGLGPLSPVPLWEREGLGEGGRLVAEFQQECRVVRRALDGDLSKCINDGKSLIVEGLHLDPGLFLAEFGGAAPAGAKGAGEGAAARGSGHPLVILQSVGSGAGGGAAQATRSASSGSLGSLPASISGPLDREASGGSCLSGESEAAAAPERELRQEDGESGAAVGPREPLPPLSGGPVFVPLVLAADEADHRLLVHGWRSGLHDPGGPGGGGGSEGGGEGGSTRGSDAAGAAQAGVLARLREVQEYLVGYGRVGVPVFSVSADNFSSALDAMHDYVLGVLERIMAEEAGAAAAAAATATAAAATAAG